jgi:hypothetical protein
MSTLSELHAGLGKRLSTIRGLRVSDHLPEQINPPQAVVMLNQLQYHQQMAQGLNEYRFFVLIAVGRMGERTAQVALDSYISPDGPQSIRAAIEADPTLGGAASDATVVRANNVQQLSIGDAAYLTVEFEVTVRA